MHRIFDQLLSLQFNYLSSVQMRYFDETRASSKGQLSRELEHRGLLRMSGSLTLFCWYRRHGSRVVHEQRLIDWYGRNSEFGEEKPTVIHHEMHRFRSQSIQMDIDSFLIHLRMKSPWLVRRTWDDISGWCPLAKSLGTKLNGPLQTMIRPSGDTIVRIN